MYTTLHPALHAIETKDTERRMNPRGYDHFGRRPRSWETEARDAERRRR